MQRDPVRRASRALYPAVRFVKVAIEGNASIRWSGVKDVEQAAAAQAVEQAQTGGGYGGRQGPDNPEYVSTKRCGSPR